MWASSSGVGAGAEAAAEARAAVGAKRLPVRKLPAATQRGHRPSGASDGIGEPQRGQDGGVGDDEEEAEDGGIPRD